jgi:hypothetical protein
LVSYALAGFATAIKLTNAPFAIALLVLEIFRQKKLKAFCIQSLKNVAALTVGYVAGGGIWQYHLWSEFRSPVFPLYNGIFRSPYYPDANIPMMVPLYFPDSILKTLFYPFYWIRTQRTICEVYFHDPRLAMLYTLLIVFLVLVLLQKALHKKLLRHAMSTEFKALLIFMVVSFVLWQTLLSNVRYLIPVFLLAAPAMLVFTLIIVPIRRLGIAIGVGLLLITIFCTSPMSWGRLSWQPTWFGVQMPIEFIGNRPMVITAGNEPLGYLIPHLPKDSEVINVDGFMYTPDRSLISPRMHELLSQRIVDHKAANGQFFTMTTDSNIDFARVALGEYGFKILDCQPVATGIDMLKGEVGVHKICRLSTADK